MPFILLVLMSLSAFAGNRDGLLYMRSDYCVCQDGRPVSYGNCASFCSGKETDGAEILYTSFNIVENKKYKDVFEWCTKANPWDFRNPKCEMSFKDESGRVKNLETIVSGNHVSVDVSSLDYDKIMVFHLTETISKAKSSASQLVKYDPSINYPLPLKAGYLNQFTCVSKSEQKKYHFYFAPQMAPSAQDAASDFFCHDWTQYGQTDSETFPRYEEVQSAVTIWPNTNPLFYDNDGNGNIDVNDAIRQRTKLNGGSIPVGSNFFNYFKLPGNEDLYARSGANKLSGSYTMNIWIDQTTYYSYCPNEAHYNSSNPLFRALGDVVAVSTEGLYAGVESEDKSDVILLRESDIKSVWFYLKNNQPKVPNDQIVNRVTVYFYYPLDKRDPYTQKPDQKLYKVSSAEELGMSSSTNTSYPAHDRKLACIPRL